MTERVRIDLASGAKFPTKIYFFPQVCHFVPFFEGEWVIKGEAVPKKALSAIKTPSISNF